MCLWDSSQHAKTGEVLQQAVLVKRDVWLDEQYSTVPTIHYCCFVSFNESVILCVGDACFLSPSCEIVLTFSSEVSW